MTAANVPPYTPEIEQPTKPVDIPRFVLDSMAQAITPGRSNAAHQRVRLKNTAESQVHHIKDRYETYHAIKPGQTIEIDMLVDEIKVLAHYARTDRGFFPVGSPRQGQAYPAHPVRILGITPEQAQAV